MTRLMYWMVNGTLFANAGNIFVVLNEFNPHYQTIQSFISSTMSILTFGIFIYNNWGFWRKRIDDSKKQMIFWLLILLTSPMVFGCSTGLSEKTLETNAKLLERVAQTDPVKAVELSNQLQIEVINAESHAQTVQFLTHSSYIAAGVFTILSILSFVWAFRTASSMLPGCALGQIAVLQASFSLVASTKFAVIIGSLMLFLSFLGIQYQIYSEYISGKSFPSQDKQ